MRNLDQRITLVMFLRCFIQHPLALIFLTKKRWCTPFIASKFAQIVLQDNKTWTLMDNMARPPSQLRVRRTHSLFPVVLPHRESDVLSFCFRVSSRPDRQAPR